MRTGLHAPSWGLQRLGIGAGIVVIGAVLLYCLLVIVIIVGQAAASWGH